MSESRDFASDFMTYLEASKGPSPSELLDSKEAASFLRVTPRTLRNWRHRGDGPPYIKLGRAVRYTKKDLEDWIKAQRVGSCPSAQR